MRSPLRFAVLGLVLLVLLGAAFAGGIGSGYLAATYIQRDVSVTPGADATTEPPASPTVPVPDEPTNPPTRSPAAAPADDEPGTFELFWEVLALVQEHYYGEIPDMRELTYAAIRGMLGALGDAYTALIEPDFAAVLSEDATGEFQGIGAFVGMNDQGWLEIISPFEGGPADQAGLRSGDLVVEVNGVSLEGKTLYEGINLIRGPAGTDVTLLVAREGEPELCEVVVTRARFEIPITQVEMREDGVGYLRLSEFSATAAESVESGLGDLLGQDAQGIVLDLRQNPGGWLDQSVEVADLFLDEGLILIERWSDGTEQRFTSGTGDLGETVPLVVLVDRGTASASEIVAGAIQDRGRAVLVGETTYGKGSVQRPFPLSDGSELRVTIAHWFTPDDRAINGSGLVPDLLVPWPEESGETEADPQLERAVQYLLGGE